MNLSDVQAAALRRLSRDGSAAVGGDRNGFLFSAWSGGKVLVSPRLRGGGNCMKLTCTIFQSGEQQAVFGLTVPPMPAGTERDSACVDRAAGQFYRALAAQGM